MYRHTYLPLKDGVSLISDLRFATAHQLRTYTVGRYPLIPLIRVGLLKYKIIIIVKYIKFI